MENKSICPQCEDTFIQNPDRISDLCYWCERFELSQPKECYICGEELSMNWFTIGKRELTLCGGCFFSMKEG